GEFGQKSRVLPTPEGGMRGIVPGHPIRHSFGGAVKFETTDHDGVHADIHNHPAKLPNTLPNQPSLTDQWGSREMRRRNPAYKRSLIQTPKGLISYDGSLPLKFESVVDEGPG